MAALCGCLALTVQGQEGMFIFSNPTALTRIGSIDGPLAGEGMWAQMFAGLTPETLDPLGSPAEHGSLRPGWAFGGLLTVPGSDSFATAYAQMYAWDGQMWGTEFSDVPVEWLGNTDIVPVNLTIGAVGSFNSPRFTRPAVVPVPEPSTVVLAVFGTLLMLALQRSRGRTKHA